MKRILSGLQPTGQLHLGNYAGAIRQFLDLQGEYELFVFVASYHTLTTIHDAELMRANTRQVVTDYLAFGLNPERCNIYLQQDVPQVTELSWILSCLCPLHLMDKAVSYKDKIAKGIAANLGLYSYPILQAADILIVDADVVPVGKDQVQHIEITRDIAQKFNNAFGDTLKLPEYRLREDADVLPGIDGEKMSKSYDNTIDPFMEEKPLRKRIMKIKTDSTPVEDAKNPDTCPVFQIFKAVAGGQDSRTQDLAALYRAGGMGYGTAKQALFELVMDHFGPARERRVALMRDQAYVDQVLKQGAAAAQQVVTATMERVRTAIGLR